MPISPQTLIVGGARVNSGVIPPNTAEAVGGGNGTAITPVPPTTIPDINLLSPTLDVRAVYSGPTHLYWAQNGLLQTADENIWPLEYRDGVAVGRSLPEPQATNFQQNCRASTVSNNVIVSTGSTLSVDASGAPDGKAIALLPVISEYYLVSQDVGGVDLQPGTPYNLTDKWTRLAFPITTTSASRCRIWLARDLDDSSGVPFVFLTQDGAIPVDSYVFSWYARLADGDFFHGGIGVIEIGNFPYATSPIITEGDATLTRAASSVSIPVQGDAVSIAVIYSDQTSEIISFNGANAINLPFATWHWGEKYATRIKFLKDGIDLSPIDLTSPTLDSRVTYSGPSHTYYDSGSNLATSNENEWPLEFLNGVAIGRHEPEPEAKNYAIDSGVSDIRGPGVDGSWMFSTGTIVTIAASVVSQFPVIQTETQKVFVSLFNVNDGVFLVPMVDPGTGPDWERVVEPFINDTQSDLRWYTQRETASSYLYEKCLNVPVGNCVASVFRRLTDNNMQATAPQVEMGTVPTSPIFNGTTEQNIRSASSVVVNNPGVAKGIMIHYSDNTQTTITFTNNQAVIPLSSQAWATRYIQQITFTF